MNKINQILFLIFNLLFPVIFGSSAPKKIKKTKEQEELTKNIEPYLNEDIADLVSQYVPPVQQKREEALAEILKHPKTTRQKELTEQFFNLVTKGDIKGIQELEKIPEFNINAIGPWHSNALALASMGSDNKHFYILAYLVIRKGLDVNSQPKDVNNLLFQKLYDLAFRGRGFFSDADLDIINLLINLKLDINQENFSSLATEFRDATPLILALYLNYFGHPPGQFTSIIEKLIKLGADPNKGYYIGQDIIARYTADGQLDASFVPKLSALDLAIANKDKDLIDLLLKNNARPIYFTSAYLAH